MLSNKFSCFIFSLFSSLVVFPTSCVQSTFHTALPPPSEYDKDDDLFYHENLKYEAKAHLHPVHVQSNDLWTTRLEKAALKQATDDTDEDGSGVGHGQPNFDHLVKPLSEKTTLRFIGEMTAKVEQKHVKQNSSCSVVAKAADVDLRDVAAQPKIKTPVPLAQLASEKRTNVSEHELSEVKLRLASMLGKHNQQLVRSSLAFRALCVSLQTLLKIHVVA